MHAPLTTKAPLTQVIAVALAFGVALSQAQHASAQELLFEVQGQPDDSFWLVTGIGDLDGDGVPDLVTSGAYGPTADPQVRARSGRDGSLLWNVSGVTCYGLVPLGDLDGDGIEDLLSTEPLDDTKALDAGAAYVRSGKDGSILRSTYGSVASQSLGNGGAAGGDVDGDGAADYLVHESEPSGRGEHVYACAGASGAILFEWGHRGDGWGAAYCGLGDLNGDGRGEIAIGEPARQVGSMPYAGRIYVYSGMDASLLYRVDGSSTDALLGLSLASFGDLDGDGIGELLAGAPGETRGNDEFVGALYVLSGVDGHVLVQTMGELEYDQLGWRVAALRDVNGDGVADYGATAYGATFTGSYSGSAYVFSGATGNRLYRFDGRGNDDNLHQILDGSGDANGDGLADFLLFPRDASGNGRIERRGGNDLWLEARPRAADAGETVAIGTLEGIPGNPTLLAIVAINGSSHFQVVAGLGQFRANRTRVLLADVPPGISGMSFGMKAWALGAGGVIDTAVETFVAK